MADRYYGPVSTHRVTVGEEGLHLAAKNLMFKTFLQNFEKTHLLHLHFSNSENFYFSERDFDRTMRQLYQQ
jgi:hypothetical protein